MSMWTQEEVEDYLTMEQQGAQDQETLEDDREEEQEEEAQKQYWQQLEEWTRKQADRAAMPPPRMSMKGNAKRTPKTYGLRGQRIGEASNPGPREQRDRRIDKNQNRNNNQASKAGKRLYKKTVVIPMPGRGEVERILTEQEKGPAKKRRRRRNYQMRTRQ